MADEYRDQLLAELKACERQAEEIRIALQVHDRMAGRRSPQPSTPEAKNVLIKEDLPSMSSGARMRHGMTLLQRVEAAIQQFGDSEFTVPDVEDRLAREGFRLEKYSRARLAKAMTDLEQKGKVIRTARPGGVQPNRFALPGAVRQKTLTSFGSSVKPVMHG